jgi:hypothetical protein
LVVATRVQDELTEQLSVLGDHPNLQTIDEDQDARADELAAESENPTLPGAPPDVRARR